MKKPVRLEINTNGVWHLIALFDVTDGEQVAEVLANAEALAKALIWDTPNRPLRLRVAMNDDIRATVCTWTYDDGWRDPRTGDPV